MHFVRRFGIVESMKKKILDFIELHHMLEGNDRVIAGISGGSGLGIPAFCATRTSGEDGL